MAQMVKSLPAMQGTWIQSLGWEDPLEREWQPIPVFLPGEFYGQRSLAGYNPWCCEQLDTTEQLTLSLLLSLPLSNCCISTPHPQFVLNSVIFWQNLLVLSSTLDIPSLQLAPSFSSHFTLINIFLEKLSKLTLFKCSISHQIYFFHITVTTRNFPAHSVKPQIFTEQQLCARYCFGHPLSVCFWAYFHPLFLMGVQTLSVIAENPAFKTVADTWKCPVNIF